LANSHVRIRREQTPQALAGSAGFDPNQTPTDAPSCRGSKPQLTGDGQR
jgi:hypothetical protein